MAHKTWHRSTIVEQHETIINRQTIKFIVKRSFRAKHVRLEVKRQTGLTIVVPHYYRIEQLSELLKSKERWIASKLAGCNHFQSLLAERKLRNGDTIPFLGRDLKLVKRENHSGITRIMLAGDTLSVSPELFTNDVLESSLEQWYRMEAAKLINERARKLNSQMGTSYKQIVIRGQKTRWGSCSHKKNLSFNWRLMMTPEPVLDYVIIHELTHLKEMNHSKKFWKLVAQYCPEWQELKRWLKQHEADLTAKL